MLPKVTSCISNATSRLLWRTRIYCHPAESVLGGRHTVVPLQHVPLAYSLRLCLDTATATFGYQGNPPKHKLIAYAHQVGSQQTPDVPYQQHKHNLEKTWAKYYYICLLSIGVPRTLHSCRVSCHCETAACTERPVGAPSFADRGSAPPRSCHPDLYSVCVQEPQQYSDKNWTPEDNDQLQQAYW